MAGLATADAEPPAADGEQPEAAAEQQQQFEDWEEEDDWEDDDEYGYDDDIGGWCPFTWRCACNVLPSQDDTV